MFVLRRSLQFLRHGNHNICQRSNGKPDEPDPTQETHHPQRQRPLVIRYPHAERASFALKYECRSDGGGRWNPGWGKSLLNGRQD